jgi:dephospho-CoA kinase
LKRVVGLTGGIGSGKSTVAARFAALGATVVDTDAIARSLTAAGGAAMPEIAAAFGAEYVAADGGLDRAAMRRRAFDDGAARTRLEAILHPAIRAAADAAIAGARGPYVLLEVPLLFETRGYLERVWRTLVVDCPDEIRVARRRALRAGAGGGARDHGHAVAALAPAAARRRRGLERRRARAARAAMRAPARRVRGGAMSIGNGRGIRAQCGGLHGRGR